MLNDDVLNECVLLSDVKVYGRVVDKDNKLYADIFLVLSNGKDFQLIPNYRLYDSKILAMFRYSIIQEIAKSK